jgi:hypothetical protein
MGRNGLLTGVKGTPADQLKLLRWSIELLVPEEMSSVRAMTDRRLTRWTIRPTGSDMKTFLSFPSEHEIVAREVKDFVGSVGVECWFYPDNVVVGQDWDRERKLAQAASDLILLLCAKQTNARDGVYQREIKEALRAMEDKRPGGIYLLPIRVEDAPLPAEFAQLLYVDYFLPSWRQKLAAGFVRAIADMGETVPPMLEVAAKASDEGGITIRSFEEKRPEGDFHLTWLQYQLPGEYWQFVNGVIASKALGELYATRRRLADWGKGGDWEMQISESHRKGQLVSLTIGHSDYYSGAAHPNHGLSTINILGEEAGIVPIDELFNYSPDALAFLTEYVNLDLKRQYLGTDDAFDVSHYAETYGWDLFKQFGFNEAGMRLNLSAVSGLPHVLGYHEIYVPWEAVGAFLAPVPRRILLGTDEQADSDAG